MQAVAFVVIGGVAVAHHGYIRATKDIDIVPEPSDANLRRLWDALVELEAEPRALQDFGPEQLPEAFTRESLLKGGNWDLLTTLGRIAVLQFLQGKLERADDYAALVASSEQTSFDFGVVRFVGYRDLVDLKTLAGRDQDLVDIRALREARGDLGA